MSSRRAAAAPTPSSDMVVVNEWAASSALGLRTGSVSSESRYRSASFATSAMTSLSSDRSMGVLMTPRLVDSELLPNDKEMIRKILEQAP